MKFKQRTVWSICCLVESSLKDLLFDLVAEDFDIDVQPLKEFVEQMEKEKDLNSIHSFLKVMV